jgi:hypothetical protein
MSEEQEGGWSGLKKTVIGIGGTVATAVGVWVTTQVNTVLGVEDEEAAIEQVAPAQNNQQSVNVSGPAITINVPEQQKAAASHTTVIKETVREVPAAQPAPAPVEEKKETTAERIARLKKEKAERDGASN